MNRRQFLQSLAAVAVTPLALRLEHLLPEPDASGTFGVDWEHQLGDGEMAHIEGMRLDMNRQDWPKYNFIHGEVPWGDLNGKSLTNGRGIPWIQQDAPQRFVSHAGSDASDGLSEKTAWRTLEHAAKHAPAGADVFVAPGIYTPFDTIRTTDIRFHGVWCDKA
jgi:hypothetical protein